MAEAARKNPYRLIINEREYPSDAPEVSGRDIITLAKFQPVEEFSVVVLSGQGTHPVGLEDKINLEGQGTKQFRVARTGESHDQTVDIIINGQKTSVKKGELSYSNLVRLAYPESPEREVTIDFTGGPKERPEDDIEKGGKVQATEGMVINVTPFHRT